MEYEVKNIDGKDIMVNEFGETVCVSCHDYFDPDDLNKSGRCYECGKDEYAELRGDSYRENW